MPVISLYDQIRLGKVSVNQHSPAEYRFWSKIEKTDSCWNWIDGAFSHNGYGYFTVNYRSVRAHRYSYELHFGNIPEGKHVLHECDNPACVNPSHLFLGDYESNQRDKFEKDRQAKGEAVGTSFLTEDNVLEIRRRYEIRLQEGKYHDPVNGQGALAREFNTTQANISDIVLRKSWRHI